MKKNDLSYPTDYFQAGQTFVTLALFHAKTGNKHDSATNYVDAANCFKKSDPKGGKVLTIESIEMIINR